MREETVESAMSIIMSAGDARLLCAQALTAAAKGELDEAKKLHADSKRKIAEAHHVQTDVIQAEMGGGPALEYCSLFAHAQDTLMTVYSEINMTKHLLNIFTTYEQRLVEMSERIRQIESR